MEVRRRERAAQRQRRRWFQRVAVLVGVAVVTFSVLVLGHSGSGPGWTAVNNIGQLLASLSAAVGGFVAMRRSTARERWGWRSVAMGCLSWSLGQGIWTLYTVFLQRDVPSPGPSDVLFLLAPLLWTVGILSFVEPPAGLRSQISGLLEGLMVAGGIFLPAWLFGLAPVARSSTQTMAEQIINLSYPLLDIVVLASLLFVVTRERSHLRGSLAVLALGLAAIAIADSAFWYLNSIGNYLGTNAFDIGWFAGFLTLGLGAVHPGRTSQHRRPANVRGWKTLTTPDLVYAAGLCATVLGVFRAGSTMVGTFERATMVLLLLIGFGHRLAALAVNHSLTVGLEHRVRSRTQDLEKEQRYFAALIRSSSDIVTVVNADRTIRSVSRSLTDIYGWSHHDVAGRTLADCEPFGPLDMAIDNAIAAPARVHRVEWDLLDRSGVTRSAESTVSNLLDDSDIAGIVINTRDVTDRALLETQLRHQAFHDPLTGLPNRGLFTDRVGHALRRSGQSGLRVGIAMVDLDGFKVVNDSHGHHAGDTVLRAVAHQLTTALAPGETVARLGGDEFAILVEDIDDTVAPADIAQRLLDCIRVVVDVDGVQYEVRGSVGLAISSRSTSHPADAVQGLLRDADIAMYSAKHDGRGAARVFRPEMYADAQRTFEMQNELRGAIERGEMVLFYQPTFSLSTGQISGFEALIRWKHPTGGLISPAKFIPLAEETGLIVALGDWVMRTAIGQLAAWSREFGDRGRMSMSINVSVGQLRSPSLLETLRTVIDEAGIDPTRIVLEITESMLITDTETVVGLLRRMSELGVRIAIDDFGTGYASLANLQSLPLNVLKIDRTFVSGESENDGAPLLRTILNIGKTLGLQTVGEGIENRAQLDMLREGGCDLGQGYYLARPLPADAVHQLLVASSDADRRGRDLALPVIPGGHVAAEPVAT